jgi:glycosyltransferase involved in cell wall biosynthesis
MKILVATDAWHPQVNGVVRTLTMMAEAARALGAEFDFLTPESFRTIAMPSYRDLRVALPGRAKVAQAIEASQPDAIHIATEGPIGLVTRRYCIKHGLPFTTSFHTRFPDYVSARAPVPESWVWATLRWFHGASRAVMAATPALAEELQSRGFPNVALWPRGVDINLFHPRDVDLCLPKPVFLCVGRVAVEKNLKAFLSLDLPGTKVIVGDGPARLELEQAHPDAVSARSRAKRWPRSTPRPTSSCFRAGPTRSGSCCSKRLRAACRLRRFRWRGRAMSSARRPWACSARICGRPAFPQLAFRGSVASNLPPAIAGKRPRASSSSICR